ncbi:MAG TPA: GAF domain-containing protein [Anaerolineales bacterium]|nr:GAF domain-containing protein [Anaerolineales bacterium]
MTAPAERRSPPRVLVVADVDSNARSLIERILQPAGVEAWSDETKAPAVDVLLVDVTQLRGDPLAGLRARREQGDEAPAVILAAHFPPSRLRDLFHLNVGDVLLKPYRPVDLVQAIYDLTESRSAATNTQTLSRSLETLREQTRRRTEEMRLLSEIGRAVASLGDLEAVLARVVEAAVFVTDAEEANIYLADPGTNELSLRASKQAGDREATLQKLRVSDTLVGQVFSTGLPILREPPMEGGQVKVQTGFLVQSLIKVPIRVRNEIVGVLGVYNRLAPRAFNDNHLTVLSGLADWAGVALEHAELVRQAQQASKNGPVPEVPQALIDGVDHAVALLERMTTGRFSAGVIGQKEIRNLLAELRQARSEPMTSATEEAPPNLVDIQVLIRQVAAELRPIAARRGLEMIAEIEPGIPLIPGDRGRILQIVGGLTAAAIRRTHQGRIIVDAHTFSVRNGRSDGLAPPDYIDLTDGPWVAVTVGDTSPGLSPDTVRALTAERAEAGTGELGPGLTMGEVRLVTESLGGALWHDQTPAGTLITVALPAG